VTSFVIERSTRRTRSEARGELTRPARAKEVDADRPGSDYEEIGWTSLLADVVREDRAERVGGTVRARPSVAAR
jgi:hypothetical protein